MVVFQFSVVAAVWLGVMVIGIPELFFPKTMTRTKHAALTNNQYVVIVFGPGCGFAWELLVIGIPGFKKCIINCFFS